MATFPNKESLATKRSLIIFIGLIAGSGGYVLFLAILAPQQLAEATSAATNVICNGCVGSSDIADNSIQSRDIQNGQVGTADIGTGQVRAGDIADGQVTSNKISDIDGVNSVDIVDGEITAADIDDDTIQPNIQRIQGEPVTIPPSEAEAATADCPAGTFVTGGGYALQQGGLQVIQDQPGDENTWLVITFNPFTTSQTFNANAVCIGNIP